MKLTVVCVNFVEKMDSAEKECLIKTLVYTLDNLRPPEILSYLVQDGIISTDDEEEISCRQPRRRQAQALLRTLLTCGPDAFEAFLKALNKTNQCHIHDKLQKQLAEIRRQQGECRKTTAKESHEDTDIQAPVMTTSKDRPYYNGSNNICNNNEKGGFRNILIILALSCIWVP